MKKLYILAFATLFMAACSGDDNDMLKFTDIITFNVTDNNMISDPDVIPSDAMSRSNSFFNHDSFSYLSRTATSTIETDLQLDEPLVLVTTVEDGIQRPIRNDFTRATLINNDGNISFGVSEFKSGLSTAVGSFTNLRFNTTAHATTARKVNTGVAWEEDAQNVTYQFYAYAPYLNTATNGLSLTDNNTTITYNANNVAVGNQQDLMTAYATSTYNTNGVDLTFGHRLTAVTVKLNTSSWSKDNVSWNGNYTIKSVKFEKINYSNKLNISTGAWSTTAGDIINGDYLVNGITESSTAGGTAVVNLMMIPQDLGTNVKLTITIQDNSTTPQTHTLTASLNGTTWTAGQTVTYEIGTQGISTFQAVYPTGTNAWGGSVQGPVSSYQLTSADANEKFGMYVVNGSTLVYSNIEMSVTNAGATATLTPVNGNNYFFSKNYKYFLYYPYKSSYTSSNVTPSATTADAFFDNVIANWAVSPTNQSSLATYRSLDLQSGMVSGSSGTVSVPMKHMMGVIAITMTNSAANTIPDTWYYDRNTANKKYETTQKNSAATRAAGYFSGTYLPCPSNEASPYTSDSYYYIVKKGTTPNATVKFVSKIAQWDDLAWNAISTTTVGINSLYAGSRTAKGRNIGRVYYYVASDYNPANMPDHSGASESPYTYTLGVPGTYRMECWGAAGGYGWTYDGSQYGRGAYTAGDITFTQAQYNSYGNLYVYVGGRGQSSHRKRCLTRKGGYNGGGTGEEDGDNNDSGGGGGGATDIRVTNGAWNNATSLRSRIMVAGGGGGGNDTSSGSSSNNFADGMHGGGPNITSQKLGGWTTYRTVTVNQKVVAADANNYWTATQFGVGGNAVARISHHGDGGGGGGYYGGPRSTATDGAWSGKAPGGSSFVSGHSDCIAVKSADTNEPKTGSGLQNHYSGLIFSNIDIIRGYNTIPDPTQAAKTPLRSNTSGISTEAYGHSTDGYARITFYPYGK